jgi:hypothetical protein
MEMSPEDFRNWMSRMQLKSSEGARQALGVGSRNTIDKYRKEGAPLFIALACAALLNNIPPYHIERDGIETLS